MISRSTAPQIDALKRQLEQQLDKDVYRNIKPKVERKVAREALKDVREEYDIALAQYQTSPLTGRRLVRTKETRRRLGVWTRTRKGKKTVHVGGRSFGAVAVTYGITRRGTTFPERRFIEDGVRKAAPRLGAVAVDELRTLVNRALEKTKVRG